MIIKSFMKNKKTIIWLLLKSLSINQIKCQLSGLTIPGSGSNSDDQIQTPLEYETGPLLCVDCYASGGNHCISESFNKSYCCNYGDDKQKMDQCTDGYRFCTEGLEQSRYKIFTCPMANCPNNNEPYIIDHSSFFDFKTTTIEWQERSSANNCKMAFKVPSDINGKLVIEVEINETSQLSLYQFPNSMNENNRNGIIENDLVYQVEDGTFFVPTDWTMYFIYNLSFRPGKLQIKSRVELLSEQDQEAIEEQFGNETEIAFDPEQVLPEIPDNFEMPDNYDGFQALDVDIQVLVIEKAISQELGEDGQDGVQEVFQRFDQDDEEAQGETVNDKEQIGQIKEEGIIDEQVYDKNQLENDIKDQHNQNEESEDSENDGLNEQGLDLDEFEEFLKQTVNFDEISPEAVENIFKEVDSDNTTVISISELTKYVISLSPNNKMQDDQSSNQQFNESEKDESKKSLLPILLPIILVVFLASLFALVMYRKQKQKIQSQTALITEVEEENPNNETNLNLLKDQFDESHNKTELNLNTIADDDHDQDDRTAFGEELKKMAGDNQDETEALLEELGDKMKDVDALMEDQKKEQQRLLEEAKKKRREKRQKELDKKQELEDQKEGLKEDEQELERQKEDKQKQIERNLEDEKKRKLKELEDAERILKEFKEKAKLLDEQLDKDRLQQMKEMEERLARRRQKLEADLDSERQKQTQEIDDNLDNRKAQKLSELEDQDLILSEFKKKVIELDDSFEQERMKQMKQLDERLASRRKKHEQQLENEKIEQIDQINKDNQEARKQKLQEIDDAKKLIEEFKKKQELLQQQLEQDRQNQNQSLDDKIALRRKKFGDILNEQKKKEQLQIEEALEAEKQQKLLELENQEKIMSEFRKAAKELDNQFEIEKSSQLSSLEERIAARRKKKEQELEKQKQEELDEIEKSVAERKKRFLEMEDAGKIVEEFKKRDNIMSSTLEEDRQKQLSDLEKKLQNRRQKIQQEMEEQRSQELQQINETIWSKKQDQLKSLEDADLILSEFKKKAIELDQSLQQERKSQSKSLEERLIARRQKKQQQVIEEANQQLDNTENTIMKKLKQKLESEDAEKIIQDFKQKEQEINTKLDQDKKHQVDSMNQKVAERKRRMQEKKKMVEQELELADQLQKEVTTKLQGFEMPKIFSKSRKSLKNVQDQAIVPKKMWALTAIGGDIMSAQIEIHFEIEQEVIKKVNHDGKQSEIREKLESSLDEKEKNRILNELKQNDKFWHNQVSIETKSQLLKMQEKVQKRKQSKIEALLGASERKQDLLIEDSKSQFDDLMNPQRDKIEKDAQLLVQKVFEKHQGVEGIKVTENFLEDHHSLQAQDLGEAIFHERQLLLKQMLFDHVSLKQKCLEEVKSEFQPQFQIIKQKEEALILEAESEIYKEIVQNEAETKELLQQQFTDREQEIKEKSEASKLLVERDFKIALKKRQFEESKVVFEELKKKNGEKAAVKKYLDDLINSQELEMKLFQEQTSQQIEGKLISIEEKRNQRREKYKARLLQQKDQSEQAKRMIEIQKQQNQEAQLQREQIQRELEEQQDQQRKVKLERRRLKQEMEEEKRKMREVLTSEDNGQSAGELPSLVPKAGESITKSGFQEINIDEHLTSNEREANRAVSPQEVQKQKADEKRRNKILLEVSRMKQKRIPSASRGQQIENQNAEAIAGYAKGAKFIQLRKPPK